MTTPADATLLRFRWARVKKRATATSASDSLTTRPGTFFYDLASRSGCSESALGLNSAKVGIPNLDPFPTAANAGPSELRRPHPAARRDRYGEQLSTFALSTPLDR